MPTAAFANLGCKVNQYETERLAETFAAQGFTLTDFRAPADVYVINTCSVTADADRKSRHMARQAARRNPDAKVVLTGCFAQMALDTGEGVDGATLLVPNSQKMRAAALALNAFPDLMPFSGSLAQAALTPPFTPPVAALTRHSPSLVTPSPASALADPEGAARVGETHSESSPVSTGEGRHSDGGVRASSLAVFPEAVLHSEAAPLVQIDARPESLRRTRATLKVQDGCRYFCAFCSIPYTRNVMASRPFADVLAEARHLAEQGTKEIVVTGVCVGAYGPETGSGGPHLTDVLLAVAGIDGIERVRLSSVQPVEVPDDLVDAMASHPHIAPHLHLSLQAGDDDVLRAMNRPYDTAYFAAKVARLRARMPRIGLTTDLIVGFPGETRARFENTLQFARDMGFARTHVFRYSPRQRTAGADLPDDVSHAEKERRHQELTAVCGETARAFAAGELGRTVPVLAEASGAQPGWLSGLTGNAVRVQFAAPASLRGQIVPVTVTDILANGDAFGAAQ